MINGQKNIKWSFFNFVFRVKEWLEPPVLQIMVQKITSLPEFTKTFSSIFASAEKLTPT